MTGRTWSCLAAYTRSSTATSKPVCKSTQDRCHACGCCACGKTHVHNAPKRAHASHHQHQCLCCHMQGANNSVTPPWVFWANLFSPYSLPNTLTLPCSWQPVASCALQLSCQWGHTLSPPHDLVCPAHTPSHAAATCTSAPRPPPSCAQDSCRPRAWHLLRYGHKNTHWWPHGCTQKA